MGMRNAARRYTVDEVLAFPDDGNRYELVDGELLVTPSPAQVHQLILARLFPQLYQYIAPHNTIAHAFFAPGDIIWGERHYVQPDTFVVPASEVTGNWRDCQTLLLAVEVISPSSEAADRVTKRQLYQKRNVATYWVVDAKARLVEVWHPGDDRPQVEAFTLRWRLAPDVEECVVDVHTLFGALPERATQSV